MKLTAREQMILKAYRSVQSLNRQKVILLLTQNGEQSKSYRSMAWHVLNTLTKKGILEKYGHQFNPHNTKYKLTGYGLGVLENL